MKMIINKFKNILKIKKKKIQINEMLEKIEKYGKNKNNFDYLSLKWEIVDSKIYHNDEIFKEYERAFGKKEYWFLLRAIYPIKNKRC